MFEAISSSAAARLSEVQRLLAHVRSLEETAKTNKDIVSTATTLKGLFYVNLYGAFEYSVTQSVQVLLQEINKFQLRYLEFEHLVFSVALDPSFNSIADVGPNKKWVKRSELLRRQMSFDVCELNDTVFHSSLQNIWYETLQIVFECLGISTAPVPDNRMRHHIDEVVENRNAVAHGRSSPHEIGRLKTADELQDSMNAIVGSVNYIVASFERHLLSFDFISQNYRQNYVSSRAQSP